MAVYDIDTQNYFNEFTPSFDPARFGFALEFLQSLDPEHTRILDIGCGDGATMALIRDTTAHRNLVGLDIAESYLTKAREKLQCDTILGSVLDPELVAKHEGEFDVAILGAVLHHLVGETRSESLRNAREALANSLALLKPGGRLLIFEPTHQPQAMMFLVFWIKRIVSTFVKTRLEIGGRSINFGQPVVSYLTDAQLRAELEATNCELPRFEVDDQSRIGGLILRRGIGIIARRPIADSAN